MSKHFKKPHHSKTIQDLEDKMDYKPTTHHYKRCFESHAPLKIGDYEIFGGSCSSPICTDADIYIGFDGSMSKPTQYPWNEKDKTHVLFYIPDMGVPSSVVEFKKMIEWIADNLKEGKKIHIGCIGGHGRTGTVLSALVTHMTGNLDSTTYVRENYCQKAVESASQIEFLNKHYNITKVTPTKGEFHWQDTKDESSWASTKTKSLFDYSSPSPKKPHYSSDRINAGVHKELHDVTPVKINSSIWSI